MKQFVAQYVTFLPPAVQSLDKISTGMTLAVRGLTLRQFFDDRLPPFLDELKACCEAEVEERVSARLKEAIHAAVEREREAAERQTAERLNQSVRRLRQAVAAEQIYRILADGACDFCNGAAVFTVYQGAVWARSVRGWANGVSEEQAAGLSFSTDETPAIRAALETRDPVVAVVSAGEISPRLQNLFGHAEGDRICVFPLVGSDRVHALLYASGNVQMAPLELLAQAAGAVLDSFPGASPPNSVPAEDLVTIQPAAPRNEAAVWSRLTAEEQRAHLSAQRFARVQVAEMRLFRAEDVRVGRAGAKLYSVLRDLIDAGRAAFRQQFLSATPTMIDYFHWELVRTLANDNVELLGEDYPGPLA